MTLTQKSGQALSTLPLVAGQASLQAISIGQIAAETLAAEQQGFVLGCTSRGVFVKPGGRWVVFVSRERFRGPLTVTLPGGDSRLGAVSPGMPVSITSERIAIPGAGVNISTRGCEVWQAPPPSTKSRRGMNPARARVYPAQSLAFANNLLGSGQGLTPAGDDVVIGLLLSLNRWEEVLWPSGQLHEWNRQIVEAAYQRTTTLSANLIECATRGQGDERLIAVVDHLVCGGSRSSKIITDLLKWGSSSGRAALVGMRIANGYSWY